MASEVGVVDVPHWDIASKGRLMPGNIFLVDFDAGRVIKDEEVRRPTLAPLFLFPRFVLPERGHEPARPMGPSLTNLLQPEAPMCRLFSCLRSSRPVSDHQELQTPFLGSAPPMIHSLHKCCLTFKWHTQTSS